MEERFRGTGSSGMALSEDGLLAWSLEGRKAVFYDSSGNIETWRPDGFPIDGAFLPGSRAALLFHYLDPCVRKIDLKMKTIENRCLRPRKWIPAAICECGGAFWLAAFRSTPANGVDKKFPYYIPVVNRFDYAVLPADRFLRGDLRLRPGTKGFFSDFWHEESAGAWKMKCVDQDGILLLNPMAEKLIRVSLPDRRISWTVETGIKPVDLAVDEDRKQAYVASAQQATIGIYDTITGRLLKRLEVGKGIRAIAMLEEKLIAVNPYRRSWMIIDPDSGDIKRHVVRDKIPTGVATEGGRGAIGFADEWQPLPIGSWEGRRIPGSEGARP